MKKVLLVLLVGLFWCNTSFAECIAGDCEDGQGTYTYSNGDKYVGKYKDDKRNGQGIYTFPNGNQYAGEYKDDKKNGQGTFTFPNGEKYTGEFKDDKFVK